MKPLFIFLGPLRILPFEIEAQMVDMALRGYFFYLVYYFIAF